MKQKLLSLVVTFVAMFACVGSMQAQTLKGKELKVGSTYYVQNVRYGTFISEENAKKVTEFLIGTHYENITTTFDATKAAKYTVVQDKMGIYLKSEKYELPLNAYTPGLQNPVTSSVLGNTTLYIDNIGSNLDEDYIYGIRYTLISNEIYLGEDGKRAINNKSVDKNKVEGYDAYHWRLIDPEDVKEPEKLTEVSMVINSTKPYATFCSPYDVIIPDNVKAYAVTGWNSENGELTLSKVAEQKEVLSAGTPVVVEFVEQDNTLEKKYYGTPAVDADQRSNDYLHGIYSSSETVPANSYVLQKKGENVKFYKVTSAFAGTPYRAYLTVTGNSDIKALNFVHADESTAISSVSSEAQPTAIFSVSGAKVAKLQKGINIVKMSNGQVKKVMVK